LPFFSASIHCISRRVGGDGALYDDADDVVVYPFPFVQTSVSYEPIASSNIPFGRYLGVRQVFSENPLPSLLRRQNAFF
jgi:hypothetical protein